jgi:hypothetical protein
MVHPEGVEGQERAARGAVATVETVVVGRQHHVETGVLESLRIGVGGGETGIAGIRGTSSKRNLKVADGVIGLSDRRGYEPEAVGIVIFFTAADEECLVKLGLVLHGVADEEEFGTDGITRLIRSGNEGEKTEKKN